MKERELFRGYVIGENMLEAVGYDLGNDLIEKITKRYRLEVIERRRGV